MEPQGPYVVIVELESMLFWESQLIMCTHKGLHSGGNTKLAWKATIVFGR